VPCSARPYSSASQQLPVCGFLLYALVAAPALAWLATASEHPILQCLTMAACVYCMAELLHRHPLQQPSKDQPSSLITLHNSTALRCHRALFLLTCLEACLSWGNAYLDMRCLQAVILWWWSCYISTTIVSARSLTARMCLCKYLCRTAAVISVVLHAWCGNTYAWSEHASRQLIAMLLLIAGIEQNPGPKQKQTEQGR